MNKSFSELVYYFFDLFLFFLQIRDILRFVFRSSFFRAFIELNESCFFAVELISNYFNTFFDSQVIEIRSSVFRLREFRTDNLGCRLASSGLCFSDSNI